MTKHNSQYPKKKLKWQHRISQPAVSGKSIDEWCEEYNLNGRSLYRWKEQLAKDSETTEAQESALAII